MNKELTKIVFVAAEAENTVLYFINGAELSEAEIKQMFIKICDITPADICTITEADLQYYCIDGRVWIFPKDVDRIKQIIAA